jgi:cardiolipin synthase
MNLAPATEKRIESRIERLYGTGDPQFTRTMGVLLGPAIVPGNRVTPLYNGREIFPAMLAAIRSARRTITFETYIYWSGEIGREFAEALAERSRAGVRVHVLLDWVGSSRMDERYLELLQQNGVEVERYHPPHWYNLSRLNNRTHRKLLVVDGRVAFTGGVGIADAWQGDAQDPEHWRDTHFRIEGPVVSQVQATFLDNWMKVRGETLHGDAYFPHLERVGDADAHMFSSSPTAGAESMHLMYMLAITAAERTIDLASAYFVPDPLTLQTLRAAIERGVRVRIIVPGPFTDAALVQQAGRASWGELLRAGAEIHQFQPTMYHCKVLVVDGRFVSVGSTNFDNRSFSLNDEANLNVYDTGLAQRETEAFERDLARSRRVSLAEWEARPWTEKLAERTAALLGSQL